MKGHILIVLAISLILALPSPGQAGIVAFGGNYQDHHIVNLNETNHVKLTFSNMIYRNNSTIQWRIMPTPSNALYLDAEGKINNSWGIFITIRYQGNILLSQALTDSKPTPPIITNYRDKLNVEIEITIPNNIVYGQYLLIFMVLSNTYADWENAHQASKGIAVGADITESLSCKHYCDIGKWSIEKAKNDENPWIIVGFILIGATFIYIFYRIIIWELKRLKGNEI